MAVRRYRRHSRFLHQIVLPALTLLLVAACGPKAPLDATSAPPSAEGEPDKPTFGQFSDVPIPTSSEMDLERTFILGAQDGWIGRLSFSSNHSTTEIFDFYRNELPKFGWQEIALVRSEISILTYSQGERITTIQIKPSTLIGSSVDMVVSPRGAETPTLSPEPLPSEAGPGEPAL